MLGPSFAFNVREGTAKYPHARSLSERSLRALAPHVQSECRASKAAHVARLHLAVCPCVPAPFNITAEPERALARTSGSHCVTATARIPTRSAFPRRPALSCLQHRCLAKQPRLEVSSAFSAAAWRLRCHLSAAAMWCLQTSCRAAQNRTTSACPLPVRRPPQLVPNLCGSRARQSSGEASAQSQAQMPPARPSSPAALAHPAASSRRTPSQSCDVRRSVAARLRRQAGPRSARPTSAVLPRRAQTGCLRPPRWAVSPAARSGRTNPNSLRDHVDASRRCPHPVVRRTALLHGKLRRCELRRRRG